MTIKDVKVLISEFLSSSSRMISQTVEYSLRAVVALAYRGNEPCTARQISELTHVPGPYLAKLMQSLVRSGLVHSRRGLHGGFALARSPQEVTIWDIVEAIEPFKRIRECPLRINSHADGLCPLHRRLDNAMETVEKSFRSTTVAELLQASGGKAPLCERSCVVTLDIAMPPTPRR